MTDLYEVFQNVDLMLRKYRKYKITSKQMSEKEFKKTMQLYQYVKITGINKSGEKSTIFLFASDSKNAAKKEYFRRITDSVGDEQQELICITRDIFTSYIRKYIATIDHLNVFNYLHKNFSTEASKGPFCSPHIILSSEEARKVLSVHLKINPLGLPKISVDDVQAIWVGAQMGQLIKVVSNSPLTGKACRYRIVTHCSGQILQDVPDDSDSDDDIDKDLVVTDELPLKKENSDSDDSDSDDDAF